MRLVRLGPNGLEGEVVAEWPAAAAAVHGRYALAAGPAGALYVASSPSRAHGPHFVWRLVRAGGGERWRVDRTGSGRGPLAASRARATGSGLTVLVERAGRVQPIGYGAEQLRPVRGRRGLLRRMWR